MEAENASLEEISLWKASRSCYISMLVFFVCGCKSQQPRISSINPWSGLTWIPKMMALRLWDIAIWSSFVQFRVQPMVNWWLGLVVWIFGFRLWKGLLLRGTPIRIPNHRARSQQFTISWRVVPSKKYPIYSSFSHSTDDPLGFATSSGCA